MTSKHDLKKERGLLPFARETLPMEVEKSLGISIIVHLRQEHSVIELEMGMVFEGPYT
jgi:hypothetical protein